MTASYEFLRLLEHRLQLQAQSAPPASRSRRREAVRWLAPRGPHGPMAETMRPVAAGGNSEKQNDAGVEITHQTLLSTAAGIDRPDRVGDRPRHDVGGRGRRLAALGYEVLNRVETHVGVGQSKRPARTGTRSVLLPRLLDWMSSAPDPDGLLATGGSVSAGHRKLVPGHAAGQAVAKRLMRVLGTSAYVPDLLMRAPPRSSNSTRTGLQTRSCSRPGPPPGSGADRLGEPLPRPRRMARARCVVELAWRFGGPTPACSRSPKLCRALTSCGWRCCRPAGRHDPGQPSATIARRPSRSPA